MPLVLQWNDIALRLGLSILAGVLVGIDRTEQGRIAGLRTTLLVCLAAAVAMIQTNLLMNTVGKTPQSFAVIDVMRLPLGILTGMGFIGAGAILRRGDKIQGVTTAATLWLVTVMGLCFGGGQLALGMTTLVMTLLVLWVVKPLEASLLQERQATLVLGVDVDGPTDENILSTLVDAGLAIRSWDVISNGRDTSAQRKVRCVVLWRGRRDDFLVPPVIDEIAAQSGVRRLRWKA